MKYLFAMFSIAFLLFMAVSCSSGPPTVSSLLSAIPELENRDQIISGNSIILFDIPEEQSISLVEEASSYIVKENAELSVLRFTTKPDPVLFWHNKSYSINNPGLVSDFVENYPQGAALSFKKDEFLHYWPGASLNPGRFRYLMDSLCKKVGEPETVAQSNRPEEFIPVEALQKYIVEKSKGKKHYYFFITDSRVCQEFESVFELISLVSKQEKIETYVFLDEWFSGTDFLHLQKNFDIKAKFMLMEGEILAGFKAMAYANYDIRLNSLIILDQKGKLDKSYSLYLECDNAF